VEVTAVEMEDMLAAEVAEDSMVVAVELLLILAVATVAVDLLILLAVLAKFILMLEEQLAVEEFIATELTATFKSLHNMKIKVKSIPILADKQVYIEYKSITRRDLTINENIVQVAECYWRFIDENEIELIGFVPTMIKGESYSSWDGTEEHFGELLLKRLALEKIV
jgi:hypothetical protein